MQETLYYGIDLSSWLLIGILTYTLIILAVLIIRYWVIKNTFCPCFPCNFHCIYVSRFRHCAELCGVCSTPQDSGSAFCCTSKHKFYDYKCLWMPRFSCRCFLPDCTSFRCICFECTWELGSTSKAVEAEFPPDDISA